MSNIFHFFCRPFEMKIFLGSPGYTVIQGRVFLQDFTEYPPPSFNWIHTVSREALSLFSLPWLCFVRFSLISQKSIWKTAYELKRFLREWNTDIIRGVILLLFGGESPCRRQKTESSVKVKDFSFRYRSFLIKRKEHKMNRFKDSIRLAGMELSGKKTWRKDGFWDRFQRFEIPGGLWDLPGIFQE